MQATRHRRHRGRRTDSQPREVLAIRLLVLGRENGSGDLAMMKRNCYNVVVFKPQTQGLGGALRCAGRGSPPTELVSPRVPSPNVLIGRHFTEICTETR